VVGTPANGEKNDQETLQARGREEVLIDSRFARVREFTESLIVHRLGT
jgi:hypothetical protein